MRVFRFVTVIFFARLLSLHHRLLLESHDTLSLNFAAQHSGIIASNSSASEPHTSHERCFPSCIYSRRAYLSAVFRPQLSASQSSSMFIHRGAKMEDSKSIRSGMSRSVYI
ncbi:hypothetical protein BD626DRAFT_2911 [Schizophyllum amplum]|uniref:Secreted protein n=1 Tax=Schizophyllum amplum TaxID=97359 RepID=A0A550CVU5_9AGAR|nr:hypothetical protein BD626DRAFT_2911 [Auriculariopsis ampla]